MAVTQLDPKTALIIVDLQKGITALPVAHPAVRSNHHRPRPSRRIGPSLCLRSTSSPPTSSSPSDPGARSPPPTDARLKALGVTQVVVTGIATATGVEATARQAYEQGFNVTLAIDAMTDMRLRAHDYSIANVFPRLGETGTTQAILDLLQRS